MPRLMLITILLLSLTNLSFGGEQEGHVNFHLEASPDDHAHKFRLIIGGNITFPTGCIAPKTKQVDTLTYGAIGQPQGRMTIQAYDCVNGNEWVTINNYFDYNSQYWFDVFIDMNERSSHL